MVSDKKVDVDIIAETFKRRVVYFVSNKAIVLNVNVIIVAQKDVGKLVTGPFYVFSKVIGI